MRRRKREERARQAEAEDAARRAEARQAGIEAGRALTRCQHAYAQAVARAHRAEQALIVLLGWVDRLPQRWRGPRTLPPPLPAAVAAAEAKRSLQMLELRARVDHAHLERERAQNEMRHQQEDATNARRAAMLERRMARTRATSHEAEMANLDRQRATLGRMVMAAMRAGGLAPTSKQLQIVSDLSGLGEAELRRIMPEGDRRAG